MLEKVKGIIEGIKKAFKKVVNFVKLIISPIGQIVGWLILIIFIVMLVIMVFKVVGRAISNWLGFNNYYETYNQDIKVIQELQNSGYQYQVDAQNFQNFRAFEYAVLMDAAEYLRNAGYAGFNPLDNQGLFPITKDFYLRHSEEYRKALEEKRLEDKKTTEKIPLVNVAFQYDQSQISDSIYDEAVKKSKTERSIDVIEMSGLKNSGSVLGGNNRVKGPFLVYEFLLNGLNGYGSVPKGNNTSTSTQNSNDNKTILGQELPEGTADQLLSVNDLSGSLIPYVYVIRDEIQFSFYFKDDKPITLPLLLNVYNSELALSNERNNDINIMTLGISPTVYPDEEYERMPYYSDVTQNTVYKIPLETILGRYMPKQQLLQAWNAMKENIESGDQIVDDILVAIKGVYEEACVLNDGPEVKQLQIQKTLDNSQEGYGTNVKNTTKGTTNDYTFVEFEKVGLEQTFYPLDGLKDSSAEKFKYVDNFITAVIIDGRDVDVTYEDESSPKEVVSLSELLKDGVDGFQYGGFIIAEEADEGGYTPPSDLDDLSYAFYRQGTDVDSAISTFREAIINGYMARHPDADPSKIKVPADLGGAVFCKAVFTIKEEEPKQVLEVEHMRMPALLVKSAKTWARDISYTHEITMNLFNHTSKKYLVPKSVTSLGIEKFLTTGINNYRGAAYEEIIGKMQEKDVVAMLTQLEDVASTGDEDSYEYMRDLFKMVQASKEYSVGLDDGVIHPDTYSYVYLPDSILYYDDNQTQKIYWLELLVARGINDEITKKELEQMRTKDIDITWQVVDYEKFEECNGKVYALYPFGSQYLRAYYQTVYQKYGSSKLMESYHGFSYGGHAGADISGREIINSIISKGNTITSISNVENQIYTYELNRLKDVYKNETDAKLKLNTELKEQLLYNPVVAVAPGKVTTVSYSGRSGFYVVIDHTENGSTVQSKYMHLKRWPLVNVDDYVGAGTLLGYEGDTGRSSAAHLHFEVHKNGTLSPCATIYPVYNPFYNKEKAEEEGYSLTSEYMSLYRTVYMVGSENGMTDTGSLTNITPTEPLVDNVEDLIQRQGEMERTSEPLYQAYDLGWNEEKAITNSYISYLKGSNLYDIYIEEAYLDKQLATEQGYFEVPPDLMGLIYGNIYVKTDMPGALPALTEEELRHILEYWLRNRYKDDSEYDFLMNTVFTDDTIKKMLEAQEKYKVSLVFALAVATDEQQLGLSGTVISQEPHYNLFSISGSENGGVWMKDRYWKSYDSYGDAFYAFCELIATNKGYYFDAGNYTIATIGKDYCEPPEGWINQVTSIVLEIMQYYTGSKWSMPNLPIASDLVGIAQNLNSELARNHYTYSMSAGIPDFDPFTNTLKIGSSKTIDCSSFVSGVLRSYGQFVSNEALKKFPRYSSEGYCSLANKVANHNTTDKYAANFDCVWIRKNKNISHASGQPSAKSLKNILAPGDILIYHAGHRVGDSCVTYGCCAKYGNLKAHHVEIFVEWSGNKAKVYSCGSAPVDKTINSHNFNTLYAVLRVKGSSMGVNPTTTTTTTTN